jgi:ribulose-phosphate 3-epimerase
MGSLICPTLLASDPQTYHDQVDRIAPLGASRVQVDLMDGVLAEPRSINPIQAWWPEGVAADIHLMFEDPVSQIETLISLRPNMIIIHAEAAGDLFGMIEHLQKFNFKTGVALLKDTAPQVAHALIPLVDHVLLFSGDLGKFGGSADMKVLEKIPEIKAMNPNVEIGWDGGANMENVKQLADGGVDVINVGGAIHKVEDPLAAYNALKIAVQ